MVEGSRIHPIALLFLTDRYPYLPGAFEQESILDDLAFWHSLC
jgi:hypothetical protein